MFEKLRRAGALGLQDREVGFQGELFNGRGLQLKVATFRPVRLRHNRDHLKPGRLRQRLQARASEVGRAHEDYPQ